MTSPFKPLTEPKPKSGKTQTYARPTPKVSRLKSAKVLTQAEKAAFLASRPDLTGKR